MVNQRWWQSIKVVPTQHSSLSHAQRRQIWCGNDYHQQSKYLNNFVEQEHRNIKRRIRPMLGFKSFHRAERILASIELLHMIWKGQYQHQAGDGMSTAEQFCGLAAKTTDNAIVANFNITNATEPKICYIFPHETVSESFSIYHYVWGYAYVQCSLCSGNLHEWDRGNLR